MREFIAKFVLACVVGAVIVGVVYWFKWVVIVWAIGSAIACTFYGLFLFFKLRLLGTEEVFDRACDGRMFRDILLWPVCTRWFEVPVILVCSLVFPFVFVLQRFRAANARARRARGRRLMGQVLR